MALFTDLQVDSNHGRHGKTAPGSTGRRCLRRKSPRASVIGPRENLRKLVQDLVFEAGFSLVSGYFVRGSYQQSRKCDENDGNDDSGKFLHCYDNRFRLPGWQMPAEAAWSTIPGSVLG